LFTQKAATKVLEKALRTHVWAFFCLVSQKSHCQGIAFAELNALETIGYQPNPDLQHAVFFFLTHPKRCFVTIITL